MKFTIHIADAVLHDTRLLVLATLLLAALPTMGMQSPIIERIEKACQRYYQSPFQTQDNATHLAQALRTLENGSPLTLDILDQCSAADLILLHELSQASDYIKQRSSAPMLNAYGHARRILTM